jgi:DNA invertase Pin-like site-specific DNA recombinase
VAKLIGYVRVSTDEQATSGRSLEVQRAKLLAYCDLHGHDLVATYTDDGASASTLDRPELQRALAALPAAHGLVVLKLDRLTRSIRDWSTLLDNYFGPAAAGPYQLHAVHDHLDTTTASGRLVLNIMLTVSQWEREVISERTREVLAHRKAAGKRVGGIPYGYQLDADGETLVPHEAERLTAVNAKMLRSQGHSLRSVACILGARGLRQRNGKLLTSGSVSRLPRSMERWLPSDRR